MTQRLTTWLKKVAQGNFGAGMRKPYPIRLTPGQHAEWLQEQGPNATTQTTCLGEHRVERIDFFTRAVGGKVILCARDDLFHDVEGGGTQIYNQNEVTSIPDNIGCCEIISVGRDVPNVEVGQIAFIDFFRVDQGYIVGNEEGYIAPFDAFAGLWDTAKQCILPLENFVVTKRVTERARMAMTGSLALHVPAYRLTEGIVSSKTSKGDEVLNVLYEEVVSVGKLTQRARPGVMTRCERKLLNLITRCESTEYDSLDQKESDAINAVIAERAWGRNPDVHPGDLVAFCKQVSTEIRVRGEFQHIVPYSSLSGEIMDEHMRKRRISEQMTELDDKPRIILA